MTTHVELENVTGLTQINFDLFELLRDLVASGILLAQDITVRTLCLSTREDFRVQDLYPGNPCLSRTDWHMNVECGDGDIAEKMPD